MRRSNIRRGAVRYLAASLCAYGLWAGAVAWAQAGGTTTGGSLWGKVTDQTKAALPGVTVTVESPAVMGSPSAVTNVEGIYRFPSLPTGEYKVTFALAGFQTLVRTGIRLTANFTATIDVQLELSTVQESVQVVAGAPVVDAVNTRLQTSFSKDVLAAVPSTRDMWAILAVTPAVQLTNIDVGGSAAGVQNGFRNYGTPGQNEQLVEGVIAVEGSSSSSFFYDYGSFEEVNVGTAAQGPEMSTPGVRTVFISKSGGNAYHGDVYADFESHSFQTSNIDTAQEALGVVLGTNRIHEYSDLNANGGGFILKDKVWWFGSLRRQDIEVRLPNFLPRPFVTQLKNYTGKVTYQISKTQRLIGYHMRGLKDQPYRQSGSTLAVASDQAFYNTVEATWNQHNPGWVWKTEWNGSFGPNLFVEARWGALADRAHLGPNTNQPRREDLVSRVVSGGVRDWLINQDRPQTTGAITYYNDTLGGSHNFKFGWALQKEQVRQRWVDAYPNNVVQVLRSGAASEVYLLLAPLDFQNRLYWNGFYATDNWNLGPVTLNVGLRFDHFRPAYPDQHREANAFAPAADIPGIDNLITWNEVSPRLGVSWNATPDGRNVLKASYGRYYFNPSTTVSGAVNPNNAPQFTRYFWTDANGDLLWQPGEQGAVIARQGGVATQTFDPNLKDPYTDEAAVWFERQLASTFGLRTGYVYRRTRGQFLTNKNLANPLEAFNIPVSVADPGPDGVTGNGDDGPPLSLLNLDPLLVGKAANTLVNAFDYKPSFHTWEIAANRRLSQNWSMNGSFALTWRNDFNAPRRTANDPPQSGLLPMRFVKLTASYDAPAGLRLSPSLRHQSGEPYGRVVSVRLNYGSQSVLAEPVGTRRKDDIVVLDLRTERKFALRHGLAFWAFFDVYNITNSNAAPNISTTSGSTFLRPVTILSPRLFKLGAKFSW